jgi:hypothetical protein
VVLTQSWVLLALKNKTFIEFLLLLNFKLIINSKTNANKTPVQNNLIVDGLSIKLVIYIPQERR